MKIIRADKTDIPEVARLFDLYRQFYQCDADLALAMMQVLIDRDMIDRDFIDQKTTGFEELKVRAAENSRPGQPTSVVYPRR